MSSPNIVTESIEVIQSPTGIAELEKGTYQQSVVETPQHDTTQSAQTEAVSAPASTDQPGVETVDNDTAEPAKAEADPVSAAPGVGSNANTGAEARGAGDNQDGIAADSRRSGRKRAAPTKYTGEGENAKPTTTPAKRAKVDMVDKSLSEETLLRSSTSKFGQVNLLFQPFFTDERAFSSFSGEEMRELCSLVPPQFVENGADDPIALIRRQTLQFNMNFRSGLRCFQEDLQAGRFDEKWLAEADGAMQARADGEFDSYKERQFELFWGQKQEPPASAGGGTVRK
ncbi:MAG: hypothetical protein M1816_000464 [Peltula sp. TS41687]|nr:MAG: hypothetical protein M1816_000464 [Peltula sp. TS41687]